MPWLESTSEAKRSEAKGRDKVPFSRVMEGEELIDNTYTPSYHIKSLELWKKGGWKLPSSPHRIDNLKVTLLLSTYLPT